MRKQPDALERFSDGHVTFVQTCGLALCRDAVEELPFVVGYPTQPI